MTDEEIISASAATRAAQIHRGSLTATEVIDAFLARIEELNAFIDVARDQAREQAAQADQAVEAEKDLGVLHGVPVAVKDLSPVEEMRYTNGSVVFQDRVADDTARHVELLIDAGAIVIGKTNTPPYGWMAKTDNELLGPTANPFDPAYNAGGSSGGSAAAVADGMVPIATGSDGAGSVRVPAAFTNTFGYKPTVRRIPNPGSFSPGLTFFHYGPHTRTVEDAAAMLSVMAKADPDDPHGLPDDGIDYENALDRGVADMTIGYQPDLGIYPLAEAVRGTIDSAVDSIEAEGATVQTVDVPHGLSYDELQDALLRWVHVVYGSLVERFLDAGWDEEALREQLPDELVERGMAGRDIDAVSVQQDDGLRSDLFDGIQTALDEVDILVTATTGTPPFRNDVLGPHEVDGVEIDPLFGWVVAAICNMTGHPAASVPAGITDQGLPVGMQLIAERFDDDIVLAASAAYERANPWEDAYPSL